MRKCHRRKRPPLAEQLEQRVMLSATVSGTIYNDLLANGSTVNGPFVTNAIAYVDLNNNGHFDPGEPSAISDADGNYTIQNVPAGTWQTRALAPQGGSITTPLSAGIWTPVQDGTRFVDVNFGAFQSGTVSGNVYNDLNGDQAREIGEGGLAGWTVFLDTNKNGVFDSGEPSAVTDSAGHYSLGGLTLGAYQLGIVPQGGWVSPIQRTTVTDSVSGAALTANWGQTQSAIVTGVVWDDANGNGAYESGEQGLGGWTVYCDLNNNGRLDPGEPGTVSTPSGLYFLGGLPSGNVIIREVVLGGTQTAPAQRYTSLYLSPATVQYNVNFGNRLTGVGAISGSTFSDANGNGVDDYGAEGPRNGITVWVDLNNNGMMDPGEPSTTSGSSGTYGFYEIMNLPAPASYAVRALPSSAGPTWVTSGLAPRLVSVDPGLLHIGNDLGLRDLTDSETLSGSVWDDSNNNGKFDSSELRLANRTVYIDLNNDGQFEAGEPFLVTNASGGFLFKLFSLGIYHIRQVLPQGWVQTSPAGGDGSMVEKVNPGYGYFGGGFGAARGGTITGGVYNDVNDDGLHDSTETGITGATVYVDLNNNGLLDPGEPRALSNSAGAYSIAAVPLGSVTVRESVPAGYAQTPINAPPNTLNVAEGQSLAGPSFENVVIASVLKNTILDPSPSDVIILRRNPDGQHIDWAINGAAPVYDIAINDPAGLTLTANSTTDFIDLDYTNGDPIPAILHLNGMFVLNGLRFSKNGSPSDPLAGHLLDIARSTVWISYGANPSPLLSVQQLLRNGYGGGAWSGVSDAITTSAGSPSVAIGYADSADPNSPDTTLNTVELKTTIIGDSNLDGTVNLADLLSLTRNFGKTNASWDQGDFNYDGSVNLSDFLALARNFGKTNIVNPLLVTSTADDGSLGTLRYAIAHSNPGDTISFSPGVFAAGSSHTITLATGQLELTHNLTIAGPGAANLSISGNNASRVFQVDAGVTANLSGLTIANGNAGAGNAGGGISNSGTINLANTVITSNVAGFGGGIYTQGVANLTNCTLSNNAASTNGGGMDTHTSATLIGCTVTNNRTASGSGGGVLDNGGTVTLINDTITANSDAGGSGGGVANVQSGKLTIANCTIAANAAANAGGGIYLASGSVTINNTVVAGDTYLNSSTPNDVSGTLAGSYNLIGDGSGGLTSANHNLLGKTSSLLDPKLGSLSNNGGPTLTMLPQTGSPLIDAGSNALVPTGTATDQRGYVRIANGTVDIGACESNSTASLAPVLGPSAVAASPRRTLAARRIR